MENRAEPTAAGMEGGERGNASGPGQEKRRGKEGKEWGEKERKVQDHELINSKDQKAKKSLID